MGRPAGGMALTRATVSGLRPNVDFATLPDLTEFEEKYVNAYMMTPEPMAAYKMARGHVKVAVSVAKAEAMRYLRMPHVQAWIRALRYERQVRTRVTQDRVMREIAVIAFSNISNYVIDDEGFVTLREGASPEAIKAVSSIERSVTTNGEGDRVITTKLKLWNKNDSLNLAGKHLGMFIERKLSVKMTLEQMMSAIAKGESPNMQQLEEAETGESDDDLPEPEITPREHHPSAMPEEP